MGETTFSGDLRRLRSALTALEQMAERRGADDLGERVRHLAARLDEGWLNVVVLGEFKRGKSTFVNALIGKPLLPMGVVPITSVVTLVTWGDRPVARIEFLDGREETTSIRDLHRYVSERANPGNRLGVRRVSAFTPSPLLREGIRVVDTPGTGSALAHNTEAALSFLPETDAAILVLSVDSPASHHELELLRMIRTHAARTFFVLNGIDQVAGPERDEVIAFVRRQLEHELGEEVELHVVSALSALEAATAGSPNDAGGVGRFRDRLRNFLVEERGTVLVSSIAGAAIQATDEELASMEVEAAALRLTVEGSDRIRHRIDRISDRAQRALADLAPLLRADSEGIVAVLQTDVRLFGELERRILVRELDEALERPDGRRKEAGLIQAIEATLAADLDSWVRQEEAKLETLFREATYRYVEEARRISAEAASLIGNELAIDLRPPVIGVALERGRPLVVSAFEPPTILGSILPDPSRALPRRWAERRVRRRLVRRIAGLVDKYEGQLRAHFADRIERSRRAFERAMIEGQRAQLAALRRGLARADQERTRIRSDAGAVQAGLEEERRRLEATRADLEAVRRAAVPR